MSSWNRLGLLIALTIASIATARAEETSTQSQPTQQQSKPRLEIYGFAMLDIGYDFNQTHPDWFDVVRPVKLPAFRDEFGGDGRTYAGVRQSRLGVKGFTPTGLGELKTTFEFELFGTGVDAGQTTFRLRHAYGEIGHFGAGQYWSPFMDIDVFPNSIEYWGPNGMVFFRNVQVRWMPIQGDTRLTIALERPGASADQGIYADRIELQNIRGRFPWPDLSGEYRWGGKKGYVEVAGIVRKIKWDDILADQFNLSGGTTGWGVNLSSNVKFNKDTLRLQYVVGEGIQNYMNDAPVDVGIRNNFGNPVTPIVGTALPLQGVVAFYDHTWNDRWTSSFGYSGLYIDNSDAQTPDAFKSGQYALANLLFSPVAGVMAGGEFQWGRRHNNSDGWKVNDYRIQFSFKYNFALTLGGQ
jgi:DcaP outer membrane protein